MSASTAIRRALLALAVTLLAPVAELRASGPSYQETFNGYTVEATPAGWVTSVVGQASAKRRAVDPPGAPMYRTSADPFNAANVVFGTTAAAGEAGTVSTSTSSTFTETLDYVGRFFRSTADTRVGITFFSSYPEKDRYYLIGTVPSTDRRLSMQLSARGAGAFTGTTDSAFVPDANLWIRFHIIVSSNMSTTVVRARFWRDGEPEPMTDAILAVDDDPRHLAGGRIGMWSADSGAAFIDDIVATSESESSPANPVVSIAITAPSPRQTIGTSRVSVSGIFDNAVGITVNGAAATIDSASKTFRGTVDLFDGANTITAIATGGDGSVATTSVQVVVDTRAPEVTITSPSANACIDASAIEVRGHAIDPALQSVKVTSGSTSVDAVVGSDGAFTAIIPAPNETAYSLDIAATDTLGHMVTTSLPVRIDRTSPHITISNSGVALDGLATNRNVTPLVRVADADPRTAITVTLDGAAVVGSAAVSAEGDHVLRVVATDCAAHKTEQTARFTIDRAPPQIVSIAPQYDAIVGAATAITATVSADTASVRIQPSGASVTVENGAFSISPALAEGTNELTIRLVDHAGNIADVPYRLTLQSTMPTIEIVENGAQIASGAVFNRAINPAIEVSDPTVNVTATLNGTQFVAGTAIVLDGDYTLAANATDAVGHTAETAVTFSIDTMPPQVTITAPQDGDYVTAGTVEVRGSVSADATALSVNGIAVTRNDGTFATTVVLEAGPNDIVVIARDRAGNTASNHVELTRTAGPRGIILTAPADGMITNRTTTLVAGQVLTASADAKVTISGADVPVDASGAFRKTDFALAEGENVIVASVQTATGETNQTSVRVTADRTPPFLRLLESGQPLGDASRFPERAIITAEAMDSGQSVPVQLTIDGTASAQPMTVSAPGGHTIVAVAHDVGGNQSRVERTIFISANGAAGCALDSFDPPSGSVVTANSVTIAGRSGGAAGVKINGVAAFVANGSFCGTAELTSEGDNTVAITCTDPSGNATGSNASLILRRVTGQPSITITTPDEGSTVASETVSVTGSVDGAVTTVEVNGIAASINNGSFAASGVRLSGGLNVIVARAMNAAGRSAAASRRVLYLKEPPVLAITSPAAALMTGAQTIDLSGVWSNLDPATIAIGGASIQTTSFNDTSGTFLASNVPLAAGQQTINVTGRDGAGRVATASIQVTVSAGAPSVIIASPADNIVLGGAAGGSFTVQGTFAAAPGATVDVDGVAATVTDSSFTANVPFSALPNGITPVVARVTEPSGNAAIDTIRIQKLGSAPRVVDVFPAVEATAVDSGAVVMVLFSASMDRASLLSAFRLETSAGAPVSGILRVDREVLTFAPAALLESGGTYTLRVATGARDLASNALAAEFTSRFTVVGTAPSTPPSVVAISAVVCAQQQQIRGNAPANARVRLEYGSITLNTTADATSTFSFQLPLSGQSGCQVARVRVVAADGTLSPATEVRFQVDCEGPQVTAATFDRSTNRVSVTFSKEVSAPTLVVAQSGSVLLQLGDGRFVGGTANVQSNVATITPAEDLTRQSFTLTVTTAATDLSGAKLAFAHTQAFHFDSDQPPSTNHGLGLISGEVYDADTGRPLAGATVSIDLGSDPPISSSTDARGRYAAQLPEGAHTIRISSSGFIAVWRQVVVAAGSGVVPIDVRLAREATPQPNGQSEIVIANHGVELRIPDGGIATGTNVSLTPLEAQSLPGLLPLGWSPLACATVDANGASISGAQLTFTIAAQDVMAAAQTITVVQYRDDRDEWQVITAVANVGTDGRAIVPIGGAGTYALVYPDRAPSLVRPPAPVNGATLQGVSDPCANGSCPSLVAKSFTIEPPIVVPNGRATVTLKIDGIAPAIFPSGTAVQAYIDEDLQLTDGSRISDPPFTTDLLLYRNLAGDTGVAQFQLAPSAKAAEVVLQVGFDHIRILPYPGRLDRGTLVGPEGGRVPGDGVVSIELPTGATPDALRATSAAISDFAAFGSIAGFTIAGGFTLTLQRASNTTPVELLTPARATFSGISSSAQYILAEVLDDTGYGRMYRLAAQMVPLDGGRLTTKTIDRAVLPIDGVIREGRYLLLAANGPLAFATGAVRVPGSAFVTGARVTVPPFGVGDLTRPGGIFAVVVPAKPAAPFTLVPRTIATGDGVPYTHSSSPDADSIINIGELRLTAQPPTLTATIPSDGATDISLTTIVKATFAPAIDPQSVGATSIIIYDAETGAPLTGRISVEATSSVVWTLAPGDRLVPNKHYTVVIAGSIRGTNGAPFGETHRFSFSTLSEIASGEVHREKIRITIPDADGHSRVIGDPGALPSGWQAVASRRGRDFEARPQATAASDGSFVIDFADRISLDDRVDLQVINGAGSVAAIFPLTPFVSSDGMSFIAPADQDVHFTTGDGKASVSVPAGAFDEPTTITITPADESAFASVPNIRNELAFTAAVNLDFEGVAKKRLDVEIAVPPGANPNAPFYLGRLGMSVRGPRMEIVDTLRVSNGRLTSTIGSGAAVAEITRSTKTFSTPTEVKNAMIATIRGGTYEATQFLQPTAWLVVDTPLTGTPFDLFSTANQSIYLDGFSLTEKRGRTLFPVAANKPFQLVGYDSSTGLEVLRVDHTGADALDPLNAIPTALITANDSGPYPVSATAARLEIVDVAAEGVEVTSVAGLSIKLTDGLVTVSPGSPRIDRYTSIYILDVTNGVRQNATEVSTGGKVSFPASTGNRLLIAIEERDVDPDQLLSFSFSSAIDLGGATDDDAVDAFLQSKRWIRIFGGDTPATVTEVTRQARFTAANNARRIVVHLPLRRGNFYRVVISGDLSGPKIGSEPGLKLGQRKFGGSVFPLSPADMTFEFWTREPGGELAQLTLPSDFGGIRDFALTGNVALVATMNGGLEAFDVSDPASLSDVTAAMTPKNLLRRASGAAEYWSVNVDRHGRVFATGMTSTFGVVHTYRLEDFVDPPAAKSGATEPPFLAPTAGASVSWRIGISVGLPIGTDTILTDRPEAIPRKMQVLLQDSETRTTRDALEKTAGGGTKIGPNGFDRFNVMISAPPGLQYWKQRITIENRTIGAHWSADVLRGKSAIIEAVVARADDELYVVRNDATYGVVSLFGFGIGVYDLNAIESNDEAFDVAAYEPLAERVLLTAATGEPNPYFIYPTIVYCEAAPPPPPGKPPAPCKCNSALRAPKGESCDLRDLTFSPDALIFPSAESASFDVYAVDQTRGLLDMHVPPPKFDPGPPPTVTPPQTTFGTGLSLSEPFTTTTGSGNLYHPRLRSLHNLYVANGGAKPVAPRARFTSASPYLRTDKNGNPQNYALLAANNFGVVVVKIDGTGLNWKSLVDVIWVPAGAIAVRVVPRTDFAVVIDNAGRVLLVDLRQIDESSKVVEMPKCTSDLCVGELFPTAKKSITSPTPPRPAAADWIEVGVDDPRIVWKTAPHTVAGNIAPVIDVETGILITGDVNGDIVHAIAALDPRIQFRIRTDDGSRYVNSIVPLGIEPKTTPKDPDSSYAAFKIELTVSGSAVESLSKGARAPELRFAVESERVLGAATEQTIEPLPPAHLRQTDRGGTLDLRAKSAELFKLQRLTPYDASDPKLKLLRYQRAYNRFVSPWIVAIADPRASEQYKSKRCSSCSRPLSLRGKNAPNVYELFTRGRVIAVRPELGVFASSVYKYLGDPKRVEARAATWMADTTRPPEVEIAAQNPPVAEGALLETVYLHSGEVETSAADMDAGGRNGFNVVIGRSYRSRTIGYGVLGPGWDSPIFKRLRELPSGDVEYRDGNGNVWRFRASKSTYIGPAGLFVALARNGNGWAIRDQRNRVSTFDSIGRIVREGDEFFDGVGGSGNAIDYQYDASGRLSSIVDPLGRTTQLKYYAGGPYDGLLQSAFINWRGWTIDYRYDSQQRLTSVLLPQVATSAGTTRPTTSYDYQAASGYDDFVDLADDLKSITDPTEVLNGGRARVTFSYDIAGTTRDRVNGEIRATGEAVQFDPPGAQITVHDALGQDRVYTIKGTGADAHVSDIVEKAVTTSMTEFGKLPKSPLPGRVETELRDRRWHFEYDTQGLRTESHLIDDTTGAEVSVVKSGYVQASGGVPGFVPQTVKTSAPGSDDASITQSFNFDGAFLKSVSAGSLLVETPEPTRENVKKAGASPVVSNNDSIATTTSFDASGRVATVSSERGTVAGGGSSAQYFYKKNSAAEYERGEIDEIQQSDLITTFSYTPDSTTIVDPRRITTVIEYDEWHRPAHVVRKGPGLSTDQRNYYDPSGRLRRQEEKKDTKTVTTEFDYDEVGRQTSVSRDQVMVKDAPVSRLTRFDFDLKNRTVTTTLPAGATITRSLDTLGRVVREVMTTGSTTPIEHRYAYDIAGNRVLTTDNFVVTASAFDVFGRETATLNADGTHTTREFDDWGRPKTIETVSALGTVLEHSEPKYTPTGRLGSVQSKVDDGKIRNTSIGWDGAGRTTAVAVDGRATLQEFDDAGRLRSSQAGEGRLEEIKTPIVRKTVTAHDGTLSKTIQSTEKNKRTYETVRDFDTDGNVTTETVGGALETNAAFDEMGNVISSTQPHPTGAPRPPTIYGRDGAGALTDEKLPDGAAITYSYDVSGALWHYTDQTKEQTQTDSDLLGRPLKRVYADGSTEVFGYDFDHLKTYKDRQDRTQVFSYNAAGQLTDIDRLGSPKLDHVEYEDGRLVRWSNKDSALSWSDFNLDGKPKTTKLTVYKDGTGLSTHQIAFEFVQEHAWDVHGERTEWTMPRPAGFTTALPWTDRVNEHRDALGNVTTIERKLFGTPSFTPLLDADYRNAGRPTQRTVTTSCGTTSCTPARIIRQYDYEPATGLLNEMTVSAGATIVAGTHISDFAGAKIRVAELLGVSSGDRTVDWSYDSRLRLQTMSNGRSTTQGLTRADFRSSLERTPRFDSASRENLVKSNVDVSRIDPPSQTTKEDTGHKFKQTTDSETRDYTYNGAELTDDGRFIYGWDEKGRLVSATQKIGKVPPPVILRVTYTYDGNDRMITRRVETAPISKPTDWSLAKPDVLTDGIPADAIFVWDPIVDRIAAVFDRSSGTITRQILHGGLGYDDPIEVTVTEPNAAEKLNRLYPIFDEAGAGHLQAILNGDAELISRKVLSDAYGDETVSVAGPAVDRVQVTGTKDAAGAIVSVDVSVRATEQVRPSTVASGVRLAALDATHKVMRTASATPKLADPYTAKFTLSGSEWADLTAGANAISVAVTNSLRASVWGAETPILAAPAWALAIKPVFSNPPEVPIEVRESVSNLSFTSLGPNATETKTLYEVTDLALLGSDTPTDDPSRFLVVSPFHALPFFDSVTHLTQVRARWLSHATGAFLSPDPIGYRDSSNLYSYCAGDPVNKRDPIGDSDDDPLSSSITQLIRDFRDIDEHCKANPSDPNCTNDYQKLLISELGDDAPTMLVANSGAQGEPIVYVNGVDTPADVAHDTGELIGQIYGSPVTIVWNPTKNPMYDIVQTLLINKTNTPDRTTATVIRAVREQLAVTDCVTLIGHSQGAAVVSSALSFLTAQEKARIDVITFGGAALRYPHGTRSLRVVVNVQDVIPFVAGYTRAEKNGLPVPGIERVSFGGGWVLPSQTHSINAYLSVEKERIKGKAKNRPATVRQMIDNAYAIIGRLQWLTP